MPKRVNIHSVERVFDGFLKIDSVKHSFEKYAGGQSAAVTRLVMEQGDAVAALAHDVVSDEIILTEQFRIATFAKGPGWIQETAAGGLKPGEDPKAAMRRELLEELGYKVRALSSIGLFYVSPGSSSERIHLFYAEVKPEMLVDPNATGVAEEQEDIAARRIPLRSFLARIEKGELSDAKTIIAGQWLALKLEREKARAAGKRAAPVRGGRRAVGAAARAAHPARPAAQPAARAAASTGGKSTAKTAKAPAKAAAKTAAKTSSKPTSKRSPKSATKSPATTLAKPPAKTPVKPPAKSAAKTTAKTAPKTAPKSKAPVTTAEAKTAAAKKPAAAKTAPKTAKAKTTAKKTAGAKPKPKKS